MNISVQKLLAKIEKELKLAKSSTKEEDLREKVYSIKILCELMLDEKQETPVQPPAPIIARPPVQQQPVTGQFFQQPAQMPQARKIEMDEANGDSLLDF